MKKYLFLIFILFLFCCGNKSNEECIARVGNNCLTKEELMHMIPESKKMGVIDRKYLNSLVSSWIKNEILFQKAKDYHFDKDKSLKYKADKYFRDLVVDEYLKYYFQSEINFSEDKIKEYYEKNKDLYIRDSKAAKVKHFFTKKYDVAKRVKNIISSNNYQLKDELDSIYTFKVQYIEFKNCIQEIGQLLFQNRPLKYYGPIVTDFGYHVIEVLERYDKDSYKKLSEVRDDIYKRLVHRKILENYVSFVDSLKNTTEWQLNKENLNEISGELW